MACCCVAMLGRFEDEFNDQRFFFFRFTFLHLLPSLTGEIGDISCSGCRLIVDFDSVGCTYLVLHLAVNACFNLGFS